MNNYQNFNKEKDIYEPIFTDEEGKYMDDRGINRYCSGLDCEIK